MESLNTLPLMTDLGINPKLPSWDGDWRTFDDYKLACQLEYDGLKEEDQITLVPRLTRNLVGKAWECCTEIDREKLRKNDGLDYLLTFLRQKRGKQQVDILGEAFEKYFQTGEVLRRDKECLNDYEQRLSTFTRDIQRALVEMGSGEKVPSEIYGWFLLNKHIRLEPSDIATLKSQTASYKLPDVLQALRKMWGGDALVGKDQERQGHKAKAYLAATQDPEPDSSEGVWYEDEELPEENTGDDYSESEVWFEEACTALVEQPGDPAVLANFQDAKKAFYKDARQALDQNRINRGFYPGSEGKGKGLDRTRPESKGGEFRGRCMRCGKQGHKAAQCPQSPGKGKGAAKGSIMDVRP